MDGESLYRIKPLGWQLCRDSPEDGAWWRTDTVFGSIDVLSEPDGSCRWKYCFDEYYDEASHDCESVDEGKRLAEAFYLGRLLPALETRV